MTASITPHLAAELRSQLAIKRVTKTQLSRDTGLSPSSISRYTAGTRDIPIRDLDEISHVLGVPAHVIVQRAEQRRDEASTPASPGSIPAGE